MGSMTAQARGSGPDAPRGALRADAGRRRLEREADELGGDVAVLSDAVQSNPSFRALFTEYNKYLLRRAAVIVGI